VETLLSAATATVTSTSVPGVTLTGTSRANTINGTGGDDVLSGLAGNDTLNGLGGNDRLLGGDGNDLLSGGLGDDYLDGGTGTDTVTYAGQTGSVIASLATGTATGAAGNDQILNVENLIGGNGNDTLSGNSGANNINGGNGDDFITGGAGDDVLAGGSNGTAGDTVNYADAISRVTVSLAITSAQVTGGAGRDTISGFENLVGSSYGDVLTGSSGNNVIRGGAGADRITGGDGTDYLYGDAGPDTFLFTANSNSRVGIARDVIFDLEVGDVLDFSAIDANGSARGNTAFINVGQNAFTGIGQLRMYQAEGTWLVEGNTTGSLDADFQVELRNWSGQPFTDLVL
jgi:Ca2+-binding RTX toxin-like protein